MTAQSSRRLGPRLAPLCLLSLAPSCSPTQVDSASGGGSLGSEGGAPATGGSAPLGGGLASGGLPAGGRGDGGIDAGSGSRASAGGAEVGGEPGAGGLSASGGAAVGGALGGGDAVTVCGRAAEGESVTLTCPDGQVISSVVFASYGAPSGECGAFREGTCAAESSAEVVETRCSGRRSCTVVATNALFDDPCSGVTKELVVEALCEDGEPVDGAGGGPFKGVANSPADQIEALGATWCYNWGTRPAPSDCDDPLFVPMVWGGGDVAAAIEGIAQAGYTTVLGFNEPNKSDQANMTVEQALALWPALTENPAIRVGSPAVSDDGRAWLEEFMTEVKSRGLRVDFIAMHWYGWNSGSCVVGQLQGAVRWASQWGLPIWVTEFGCMGSSNPDEETLLRFFDAAIPMLAAEPLVERYAWYPWNTYNHLFSEDGTITALGQAFARAPARR